MLSKAMVGASSKAKFFTSNLVIFNLLSILGELSPTSKKKPFARNTPERANDIFLLFTAHGARGETVACC